LHLFSDDSERESKAAICVPEFNRPAHAGTRLATLRNLEPIATADDARRFFLFLILFHFRIASTGKRADQLRTPDIIAGFCLVVLELNHSPAGGTGQVPSAVFRHCLTEIAVKLGMTEAQNDGMMLTYQSKARRMRMALRRETQELVNRAERVYEEKLKSRLETEHLGELIALEPESSDYVLANTFREIDVAALQRFGSTPVHIFRIGGGGAVKVGGVGRYARVS
jgi:hypothetical protein